MSTQQRVPRLISAESVPKKTGAQYANHIRVAVPPVQLAKQTLFGYSVWRYACGPPKIGAQLSSSRRSVRTSSTRTAVSTEASAAKTRSTIPPSTSRTPSRRPYDDCETSAPPCGTRHGAASDSCRSRDVGHTFSLAEEDVPWASSASTLKSCSNRCAT